MILLINPKYDLGTFFGKPIRLKYAMPPLGLAYIVAILEKNNIEVKVLDDYIEDLGHKGILEKVKELKPDIVGITCLTPSADEVYTLAKEIKDENPEITIVLGNVHASYFAENILKEKIADIIVHFEGEYTFLELVKNLENNKDISKIKGISFLKDSTVINTPPRPFIEDLDELPLPAWHRFPIKFYRFPPFVSSEKEILPVLASRGCPSKCIHCSAVKTMGKKYRKRNPKKVVDEIEFLIEKYGVKQIVFLDATFGLQKKHGMEICSEIISRNINKKIKWACETRPDVVDKEILKKMYEAGCRRICYGFESGVQLLLDALEKGFTVEEAKKAAKYTKEVGIKTIGSIIFGTPGETDNTIKQTINFTKNLDLDYVKLHMLTPFPGTPFYENLLESGKIRTDTWKKIGSFNPDSDSILFVPEGMKKNELIKMQRRATFILNFHPRMLLRRLIK